MITSKQRSFLKGLAHDIDPAVFIGKAGLTENVIKEIDMCLEARELVKIKIQEGDIHNIKNLLPDKKAGAILFRNAFYIETGNYGINEFSLLEDLSVNKKKIIENIVDKVYDKLLPGGLFILGDIEKDHIYIADNSVKDKDKYFIRNFGVAICKEPLLWSALEKDGRFEPVFYKKVASPCALREDMKVPTIWRKK